MTRAPGGGEAGAKRTWTEEEDAKLKEHVRLHGPQNWTSLRSQGLNRSGKSCRLRWVNKLRPNLKTGKFSEEEERLVLDLQKKYGNKWATIAAHLPGRTDNNVKNFWFTRLKQAKRTGQSSGSNLSKKKKKKKKAAAASDLSGKEKAATSSQESQLTHNSFTDQVWIEESSSSGQCCAATQAMNQTGNGGALLPELPAPNIEDGPLDAPPLLARTDNDVNDFQGTSQMPSGGLLPKAVLGQSRTNCSATTMAASSLQPPPVMVKACKPDMEAGPSDAPPLLARTDNDVNDFQGTSQKPSVGLLPKVVLGQSRTNCSATTVAASSIQLSPAIVKACKPDGEAFLPYLPPNTEAGPSNAAPLLARTDNNVNDASQMPSDGLLLLHKAMTAAASSLQSLPSIIKRTGKERTEVAEAPKRKVDDADNLTAPKPKRKKMAVPELERAVEESEKLWLQFEQAVSTFEAGAETTYGIQEVDGYSNLNVQQPVHVPGNAGPQRYLTYAREDLVRLQRRIHEQTSDRRAVISEIDETIRLWSVWFRPPSPDIQVLMDGITALKKALSENPEISAADALVEREKRRQRAETIKDSQAFISATTSSMANITEILEKQFNSDEQESHQKSSRVQELQAKIAELTVQLKEAEDNCAQTALRRVGTSRCLAQHKERSAKIKLFIAKLETASAQNQIQLQKVEETVANFTDKDEKGLTTHTHALLKFFASCTFEL